MRDEILLRASSAARFTGTLDDLSVADLIQILQLAGKGALITVTQQGKDSRIWCHEGAIIAAESGHLQGEAAVYRILSLDSGTVVADLQPVAHERQIFAATQRLLLEGARRKDESALLRDKLGDLQRCVQLREPLEPDDPDRSAAELELLRSFQRPRSLLEALDDSELGDFETLTALVAWLEAGQLSDTGERYTPAPPLPSTAATAQSSLMPLVASAIPRRMRIVREPSLPTWGWAALAALLLAPAGYLIGSSTARSLEPAAAAANAAAESTPRLPARYALGLRVEPSEAEIILDGKAVGRGQFETTLARDGVVHELRVSASGHVPLEILFLDAPPPRELRLDPLPEPAASEPSSAQPSSVPPQQAPALDAEQPATPAAIEPRARKRSTPRPPAKRETVRALPRARVAGNATPAADAPRVQLIDGEDPIIRVLD